MFNQNKIIKLKNVIFNYLFFYHSKNSNFAHLLIVFVNNMIKITKLSKKFIHIFNKILDDKILKILIKSKIIEKLKNV